MSDACCGGPADPGGPAPGRLSQVRSIQLAAVAGVLLAGAWSAGLTGRSGLADVFLWGTLGIGGSTFVPATLRALGRGRIGVGTLMTIAAAGAVVLGELGEAAMLAFLFSISEGLEGYAVARTRRGLRALLDLVPTRVGVLRGGGELTVDPAELVVGDRMVLRPGERLATDGLVRAGRTTLDLSAITGESIPVEAGPGDTVFAGSINGRGALEVDATAAAADSSLARMVHAVEEAQDRKGSSQRLADRVARPLVPAVMVLAVAIAVGGWALGDPAVWVERALVVLVAAAPCAFAISVPVTVVAAVGAASRHGVLIKGGAALEALARTRIVAIDKTGTLTANRPRVVEVVAAEGRGRDEVLALAAALEARAEHPLGRAILAAVEAPVAACDVEAVPGSGLVGRIGDRRVRLGRPGFIDPAGLVGDVERLQASGATVVLVEADGATVGAVAVRDGLRPEAADVVAQLRREGLQVLMLTGDNRLTASAVGRAAGITDVRAGLLPTGKADIVEELRRGGGVAMVGDGINDAPALATATVGIAMGAVGADVAIETADVALMGEDLRHLPVALDHARYSLAIMRQNLAMSGTILLVLVPLAAAGVLGLATVVATHELAEVLVIANGVRAGRGRRELSIDATGGTRPSETTEPSTCTTACCDAPPAGVPEPVRVAFGRRTT